MNSIIDDINLKELGHQEIKWFKKKMLILEKIQNNFNVCQPFRNLSIAICMHIEPKTAIWIEGLISGGAKKISLIGCIGSTRASTAAYLASQKNIFVYGKENDSSLDQSNYLKNVLTNKHDLLLDNGGDLIRCWYNQKLSWLPIGANEETRSGKLRILENINQFSYPIIVIDDSPLKQIIENTLGVGQSVIDGLIRSTSIMLGGKKVLVLGYGFCGKGIALRLKGMGATTFIWDIDPIRRLQAKLEGNLVAELNELLPIADIIITVTGQINALNKSHFPKFKSGVIIANAGHSADEIDIKGLKHSADLIENLNDNIEMLKFSSSDKIIYVLKNGNLINLAAADGNPIEIMDLGLGIQSLSAEYLVTQKEKLLNNLQEVPTEINKKISQLYLELHK